MRNLKVGAEEMCEIAEEKKEAVSKGLLWVVSRLVG